MRGYATDRAEIRAGKIKMHVSIAKLLKAETHGMYDVPSLGMAHRHVMYVVLVVVEEI